MYGLKKSPRVWFGRFTKVMKKNRYHHSNADYTLFLKRRRKLLTGLIIYVNDMINTGNDIEEIKVLKEKLLKDFEMKVLKRLKYFLGFEVLRSKIGIFISQWKYVLNLFVEIGMIDSKPVDTPIVVNHGLRMTKEAKPADKEKYHRLVGKLIYLSHTRPDIGYVVGL